MKRSLLAVCLGTLFFAACKEVPPYINFSNVVNRDTTYMVAAPTSTDPHQVLVEEFTGQSCSNCPQGHATLEGVSATNPGRVNVVGLFEHDNSTVTTPPAGATYDFTSLVALAIGNSAVYNSVPTLPNAGIDRVSYLGTPGNLISEANWSADIISLLSVTDSLNMTVASVFDTSTRVATITATVTYAQTMSTQQNLSIVIVTDSIYDYQEFPFGNDSAGYLFNDIFVGMVTTPPLGDELIDTIPIKYPGRFVQLVYSYTLPATFAYSVPGVISGQPGSTPGAINPAHCRVIAFVNAAGPGNYQIYQSAQTPLMGP